MPAHRHCRLRGFNGLVDSGVGLAQAVGPEHLPSSEFGMAQKQPPELNVVAISRTFAVSCRAHELFQLQKSLPGAVCIYAALFCFALAEFAEASHISRINGRHVMRGTQTVTESTLPLRSPHDSVDVVRARVVFHQSCQEIPIVGIIYAERLSVP